MKIILTIGNIVIYQLRLPGLAVRNRTFYSTILKDRLT